MINDFLKLTYSWCGAQHQIIQGYVLCDDFTSECQKYIQMFQSSKTFSDENFKILAAKLNNYILVIIFSQAFLIDPSKCSFLISTNNKTLPYYPKQMSYKLDPSENKKITLIDSQNNYNLREQIYLNTFERQIINGSMVPILICPKQLLTIVWGYFIDQNSYIETLEELKNALVLSQQQIQNGNTFIANTLISACNLYQKYIQIKPKLSQKEIETNITDLIFRDLENSLQKYQQQSIILNQNGRFVQQLMILVKNMISQFFLFIEDTIDLLQENNFNPQELNYILEGQIEDQVSKLTIQMHEFALIDQADFLVLFKKIKETIFDIHKDIEQFIVTTSLFVDDQMHKVNEIFQDYPALANFRTFQAIQTDASQFIVRELQNYYLIEKSNFWRPEYKNQFEFTKKILISYLEYKDERIINPNKTNDFYSSLKRMGFDPKMPIQTIQIIVNKNDRDFVKEKDSLFIEKVNLIKKGKRCAYKIYLHSKEEIVLYMIKHQVIIISFDYFNKNLWTEVEKFPDFRMKLSQGVQYILETSLEYVQNIKFYESQIYGTQIDSNGQSKLIVNFSMNMDEQLKLMKKQFCKNIHQAQKGGTAQPTDPKILAAGAIGSGIGILIVDCLDNNISWQKKLQRAGYGTAETTAFAALSMNLPLVGFLVGQTLLFYTVHKIFQNKVLSIQNKLINIGHLGIKTSMGIGSAVAGQILIPVPVLGALLGSVVGGVGLGLYHKFIIPQTKNSLLGIINRLETLIQPNGQLIYDKQAIKMMKINPAHFFDNQPQTLSCSDWLTLASVNLVNEVAYLYEIQWEEQRRKVLEKEDNTIKMDQIMNLDIEQDKLAEKLCKWEICQYYIYKENISTLKYAKQIGTFVIGMISNFKF